MAPGDGRHAEGRSRSSRRNAARSRFQGHVQATDWQTVVSRRTNQKSPKEGGWNLFFTNWAGADLMNPHCQLRHRRQGQGAAGSAGRKTPKIEQLKDAFVRASSPEEQKKIAVDIQKEAYDQVIYMPLGQFTQPSAWRKSLTGVLGGPATPIFWNIDKSE